MSLNISSPDFEKGAAIPIPFTGDGDNTSPRLKWDNLPENTKSLALIMDDPDAPAGTFVHWVVFNIPAASKGLPWSVPLEPQLEDGTIQGSNSGGGLGYYGPYPPPGKPHRYYFTLYALDTKLPLKAGASKQQLLSSMEDHVLDKGRFFGVYQRGGGLPVL